MAATPSPTLSSVTGKKEGERRRKEKIEGWGRRNKEKELRFATTLLAAAVFVVGVAGEEAEKTEEMCRRREVGEREVERMKMMIYLYFFF